MVDNVALEKKEVFKLGFFIALTVLSFASAFIGIQIGLESYAPGELALFRYLIASVLIFFLYIKFLPKTTPNLKESSYIFFAGVSGFALYNIALNYGELTVDSGMTSFIISQVPVAMALLAAVFLREHISKRMCVGILVSVVGVSLIAYSHHSEQPQWDPGILYVICATLLMSIYSIIYKKVAGKYHPIHLTAYMIWSGTFVLLFYLPGMLNDMQLASTRANWAVIYLGVVPSFIGYLSWGYVLRYLPASKASGFLYFMPIFATLMGWSILGEMPAFWGVVGGLVALGGAIIINQKKKG